MKEKIAYNPEAKVTCACGNTFAVGSTKDEIYTESCSSCHPFYTGQKKLMDAAGRVERFAKIMEKTKAKKSAPKAAVKKAAPKDSKKSAKKAKSK